ncbi:MAG TPA: alpha/beta hydrolase [Gemmataceae bacterium]|nr:alpha/beta hydrolase [Gemmataceae bacterium]
MRYRFPLVVLAFIGLHGSAHAQAGPKLVFLVNGAGGGTTITDNIPELASEMHLPLRFHTIWWCRGDHAIADYKDHVAQYLAAQRLAEATLQVRRACPNAEIYFVGNSTGTGIVLRAAEMLPAQSVERIILIAAPISATYDLRPSLRTSRAGIDNFWSPDDDLLDRVTPDWGNLDGVKGPAAGRIGFWYPRWTDAEGFDAYKNIRQYRWRPGMEGHGGHFTWTTRRDNMRCYIMPLFMVSDK